MFRAKQMIQDKTQTANNGLSLLRAVTPYWVICIAPFGRAGKRSFAVLRLWPRTSHCRRDVPSAQPLPDSLNTAISPLRSTRLKGDQPRCAVKSGDKPAAVLFVFLKNLNYSCMSLKIYNNQVKPSETHAICGLDGLDAIIRPQFLRRF